jgi:mono/diheme cytochrome c family protein
MQKQAAQPKKLVAHPKIFIPLISTRFDLKTSRVIIAVCSLTLSFALTAASAQTPPPDVTLTANPVFQKNCAKCHGKTAQGRHFGGPSLISDRTIATSADDLRNMINNGKGRMPKYASKLTREEVDKLVEQIKASQIKALNKE